jgi:voltage-gated potassium channel Kch
VASLGKGGGAEVGEFAQTAMAGVFLVGLILFLNRFVLQSAFDLLAKNTEVLFLASISWALIFSALSVYLGFSIEIGAFLAGLGLATLREEQQIAAWIRPLRNLFIILFFLSLGLKLSIATIISILGVVIVLSIFVLVGNPFIVMVMMGILGFRRRTAFHVAATSAQISEFSLIFVALGSRLELVGERLVNVTTAVALVTIVFSTYLIIYTSKIYRILAPYLKIFQRKTLSEISIHGEKEFSNHVVLVGAGSLGQNILKTLRKKGYEVVVVDFNPNIVKTLEKAQIPVIYGDISDTEIFERALGRNPKLIISTIFSQEGNDFLLLEVKNLSRKVPLVVTTSLSSHALDYYKRGASYVIIPRILSSNLVEKFLFAKDLEGLREGTLRKDHLEELSNHKLENL